MNVIKYAAFGLAAVGALYVLFILTLATIGAILGSLDERRRAGDVNAMIAGAIAKAEAS